MKLGFDLGKATDCAKSFFQATGIGCVLATEDGQTLSENGYGCTSCKMCFLAGRGKKDCYASQLKGLNSSQDFGGKYMFYCPLGLSFIVAPILGADGKRARITAGPFLMISYSDYVENDLNLMRRVSPNAIREIREELKNVPIVDPNKISAYATLLSMAAGFLNSFEANLDLMKNQKVQRLNRDLDSGAEDSQTASALQYPAAEEETLANALARGDVRQIQRSIEKIFSYYFYVSADDMKTIKIWAGHLLSFILHAAAREGVSRQTILSTQKQYLSSSFATKEDLLCWVAWAAESLVDAVPKTEARTSDYRFNNLKNYISRNCEKHLSLSMLAQMAGLSPCHLSSKFKKLEGQTLFSFINRERIEKSKQLLKNESLPISQVAQLVGIGDQNYFSRLFKRFASSTPLSYRKAATAKVKSSPEIHQTRPPFGH